MFAINTINRHVIEPFYESRNEVDIRRLHEKSFATCSIYEPVEFFAGSNVEKDP